MIARFNPSARLMQHMALLNDGNWVRYSDHVAALATARREAMEDAANRKYRLGDRVTKIKGSSWTGRIVGFYTTTLTPIGYAVESETENGSVQIYPESAIRALPLDHIPDAGKLRTGGGDEG